MTSPTIPHRLRGILKADGRCLTVAMDHGMVQGALHGLQDPARLIASMIDAGADALMVSYGTLKRYGHVLRGRVREIARIVGGPRVRSGNALVYQEWRLLGE